MTLFDLMISTVEYSRAFLCCEFIFLTPRFEAISLKVFYVK